MSTEYHKIETLYERNPATFKLQEPLTLKNRVYGVIKTWHWTEKVDGTNIRVIWTPGAHEVGGRSYPESLVFGGRTDNAQLHADLYRRLTDLFNTDRIREMFPDASVVFYGEGYGAGIQKGGGDYSVPKEFILFDVKVGDWWLSHENVEDAGAKLGIDVVSSYGEMTLDEAADYVRAGFNSHLALKNRGIARPAEGLVGRPIEALFDKKGHRLIVKLKTKDFAQAA